MRFLVTAVALMAAVGCAQPLVCGEGTKAEAGQCIPESLSRCGRGTRLDAGQCVPDERFACGDGTQELDGQCRPTAARCGAGTHELDGECIVADPMRRVTVPEKPEPNDSTTGAARFTLPAAGAPAVVLGGVVHPPVNGEGDLDIFVFEGRAGQRLRLTGHAVGAPSVGVVLSSMTDGVEFQRIALSSSSRNGSREVVIPLDGEWMLIVTDQSNIAGGLTVGAHDFSYTVDVELLQAQPLKALPANGQVRGVVQDLDLFAVEASADRFLFDVKLAAPAGNIDGLRALWATTPGGKSFLFNLFDELYSDSYGNTTLDPLDAQRLVFPRGTSTLAVDYRYLLNDTPVVYDLSVTPVPITSLGDPAVGLTRDGDVDRSGDAVFLVDLADESVATFRLELPEGSAFRTPYIELRTLDYEPVPGVPQGSGGQLVVYTQGGRAGKHLLVVRDGSWTQGVDGHLFKLHAWAEPIRLLEPLVTGARIEQDTTLSAHGEAWFAVYAGHVVDVVASAVPQPAVDVSLTVWRADLKGALAFSDSAGPGQPETLPVRTMFAGDRMLVQARGIAGGGFQFVAESFAPSAQFELEPNDSRSAATSVTLAANLSATVIGTLPATSDHDFFRFTLPANAALVIETQAGPSGLRADTNLTVYDASGALVRNNDDIGGGNWLSRVDWQATAGDYFVQVRRYNASAPFDGTDYTLRITGTAAP